MYRIHTYIIMLGLIWTYACSQTVIPGGNVSGIWDYVGSPYMIEGNITVPSSETLIIDPGVEVYFQGEYEWLVQGWLEAIGTVVDSILITAQDTSRRWSGIRFFEALDSSYLEYCIIEYAGESQYYSGGGILCIDSNPVISHCTIRYNIAYGGGGIYSEESGMRITYNSILHNGREGITSDGGGISLGQYDSSIIAFNNFSDNHANNGGGMLIGKCSSTQLIGNYFVCNRVGNDAGSGGGIYIWDTWPNCALIENIVVANSSIGYYGASGGGIQGRNDVTDKMVIYNNIARATSGPAVGGGVSNMIGGIEIVNSIIWRNSPDQIWGSSGSATYCNVQDGWPGMGNIAEDPMFVNHELYDFRLQWGSPCIDAGDPDPQYDDPDGSRADMGAFYYDQSVPVRILLTPRSRSIVIPAEGGSFDYTIWLTNIDPTNPEFDFWVDVTMPDGTIFGPIMGPIEAELDSGMTVNRTRIQNIPAGAERGLYSYNAYAVVETDTSFDSFEFFKLGSDGSDWTSGWSSTGESLDDLGDSRIVPTLPQSYSLSQNFPNPFNPTTAISYQLSANSFVNLTVYDIEGRLVSELVKGWRDVGYHEVVFDGRGLTSGIYIARWGVEDNKGSNYTGIQKLLLLK